MLRSASTTLTAMTEATSRGHRIVLVTIGSPGDVRPFLAIGAELRRRGHRPVVATSELYREQTAAAGLDFAPIRPVRVPGQQEPDFFARVWRERRSPGAVFRDMFQPALRESLADLLPIVAGADAVVSHTLAGAARLAADAPGLPWISAVMQPMGYLSAYEPPVLGPPALAAALRAAGPGLTSRAHQLARRLTMTWAGDWHALRAELGLPPVADHPFWEGQHSPRRSLGLFPRLLGEPQADWPPSARITGYPFNHPPGRALAPELERFLAAGPPPLVFTLGTTAVNEPGSFYAESLAAALRIGLRAVLLVGPQSQPGTTGTFPDALVTPYAPHDLLVPRARAIIHQGGIGTLAEALAAGQPMLIMPYAHDPADNAWRARRLGVARVIGRRHYDATTVARELSRLLDDPAITMAASLAGEATRRERGAERAAELIEGAISPHVSWRGATPRGDENRAGRE